MNRFCTLLGLFSQSRKIQARVIYSYSAVIKAVQRRYHERTRDDDDVRVLFKMHLM